jgi:hypothetical protein
MLSQCEDEDVFSLIPRLHFASLEPLDDGRISLNTLLILKVHEGVLGALSSQAASCTFATLASPENPAAENRYIDLEEFITKSTIPHEM